jgi:hypothetical protein
MVDRLWGDSGTFIELMDLRTSARRFCSSEYYYPTEFLGLQLRAQRAILSSGRDKSSQIYGVHSKGN